MITIRNKRTGETKQIDATQLGNYGIGGNVSATPTPTPIAPPGGASIREDIAGKQEQQPKKILGGAIPGIGGLLGGIGGGIVSAPILAVPGAGIPLYAGGTGAGAMAGYAGGKTLENLLESTLDQLPGEPVSYANQQPTRQKYQTENPLEQVSSTGKEAVEYGATDAIITGLTMGIGRLLGNLLKKSGNLWVRSALPETTKETTEVVKKKATQEAMKRAGKESTQREAKQLAELVLEDPTLNAGSQELANRSAAQLIREPALGSTTKTALSQLDDVLNQLPGKPPIESIFDKAAEKTIKEVASESEQKAVAGLVNDLYAGIPVKGNTWADLNDYRIGLDTWVKGKEASQFKGVAQKLGVNIADEIRSTIYDKGGTEAKAAYEALEKYIRTQNAAASAVTREKISSGVGLNNLLRLILNPKVATSNVISPLLPLPGGRGLYNLGKASEPVSFATGQLLNSLIPRGEAEPSATLNP